jgi:ABC-2 type transport system ATP-binding protein
MIDIKDISLEIKENKILDHVNLQCEQGRICGIIGRNGSGKTMLMKCICGFVRPSAGEIEVGNQRIGMDTDFIPNAGIIIETPGFIPYYSGIKNLRLLASIRNTIGEQEIREAMQLVGLNPDMKRAVKKYSLGMRQRLGLAQAIMENPEILILDEPFNGLDKEGVSEMRNYLLKLKEKGKTILVTSHFEEDIQVLCDKVYEMEHGKIVSYKNTIRPSILTIRPTVSLP